MQGLYTPLYESGRSSWAVGYLISLSQRQTRDFKGGTKKEEPCLISAQLRGADLGEDIRRTGPCLSPMVERKAWQKLFPSRLPVLNFSFPEPRQHRHFQESVVQREEQRICCQNSLETNKNGTLLYVQV